MNDIRSAYATNGYEMSTGSGLTPPTSGLQASCQNDPTCLAISQAADDPIPNWETVFYAFRIMVALCFVAIIFAAIVLYTTRANGKGAPQGKQWIVLMALLPIYPLLANSCGWILAEIGRQPWIVYGVLPTSAANSPTVSAAEIGITMTLYTLIYACVAVLVVKMFLKQIRSGLPETEPAVAKPAADDDAPLGFAY
jgi:cytochrome d ubiquinol oxidase subunit I